MEIPDRAPQRAQLHDYLAHLDIFLDREGEHPVGPVTRSEILFLIGHYLRSATEENLNKAGAGRFLRSDRRAGCAAIRVSALAEQFNIEGIMVADLFDRLSSPNLHR